MTKEKSLPKKATKPELEGVKEEDDSDKSVTDSESNDGGSDSSVDMFDDDGEDEEKIY